MLPWPSPGRRLPWRWPHELDVHHARMPELHGDNLAGRHLVRLCDLPRHSRGQAGLNLWLRRNGVWTRGPPAGRSAVRPEPNAVAGVPLARFNRLGAGAGDLTMGVPPSHQLAYFDFRDNLAADLRAGLVGQAPAQLMARARACAGVDAARAAEWTERFWNDLKRGLAQCRGATDGPPPAPSARRLRDGVACPH